MKSRIIVPKQSVILNFDDIINSTSTGGVAIPYNYGGLSWQNGLVLNVIDYMTHYTGYTSGVVSPKYLAFNGYGNPMSISSVSGYPFTINSFYSCAAWNESISLAITASIPSISTRLVTITAMQRILLWTI
ncbi:hypothetical protein I4U23_023250 [Adineta vaga]|nr:hypothetical protein I4U23_023250 [Adineta vaga]